MCQNAFALKDFSGVTYIAFPTPQLIEEKLEEGGKEKEGQKRKGK